MDNKNHNAQMGACLQTNRSLLPYQYHLVPVYAHAPTRGSTSYLQNWWQAQAELDVQNCHWLLFGFTYIRWTEPLSPTANIIKPAGGGVQNLPLYHQQLLVSQDPKLQCSPGTLSMPCFIGLLVSMYWRERNIIHQQIYGSLILFLFCPQDILRLSCCY